MIKKALAVTAMSVATLGVAGVSLASTAPGTHNSVSHPAAKPPLAGSVYRVESYPGGIGSGAVATVACANTDAQSEKYIAISGGFEADPGQNLATINPLAIASSFPGRMNWNTNEPKPGRLDGWVIQFAAGATSEPNGYVWALCVPKAEFGNLPVQTNAG